ncbi:MAG: hypothetical protein V3V78_00400 [Candidatus Woesearchaeota archaeon]
MIKDYVALEPVWLKEEECLDLIERVVNEKKLVYGGGQKEANLAGILIEGYLAIQYRFVTHQSGTNPSGRNYVRLLLKDGRHSKAEENDRAQQKFVKEVKDHILMNYLEIQTTEFASMTGSDA